MERRAPPHHQLRKKPTKRKQRKVGKAAKAAKEAEEGKKAKRKKAKRKKAKKSRGRTAQMRMCVRCKHHFTGKFFDNHIDNGCKSRKFCTAMWCRNNLEACMELHRRYEQV